MTIQAGDRLPEATFTVVGDSGPAKKTTAEAFGGRRVLLFAVPGAFTPTCHRNHLPGYLERADEILARNVDAIACVSTNDIFVLDHWSETTGAKGRIEMLSDGNGDFTRAIGLELDLTALGLGKRSTRFAMLIDDGTVAHLEVESNSGEVANSSAATMLEKL